jgi:virginiamycin B lyase
VKLSYFCLCRHFIEPTGQEIYGGKSRFLSLAGKRREKRSAKSSSSKKIIAYAAIGILALAAVSVTAFAPKPPAPNPVDDSRDESVRQFQQMYCGSNTEPKTTNFVTEYGLPSGCEMPLSIEVESGKVWYMSTKNGTLGSYDIASGKFEDERPVPSWPSRTDPTTFSMSWSAKSDGNGNIWITDERQKAIWRFNLAQETFSMFPVAAKLPSSIDFDSQGKIYFSGVQSTSIFIGDPSKMKDGTSEGITEVALPLDGFSGIDMSRVATGSLTVDKQNNKVWVSLLAFQIKGQLFEYDIASSKVASPVDLPSDLNSPVGLAVDSSGNLWVTDHGTNMFFKYDKASGDIERFVTSIATPQIYAGIDQPRAYTLPYWIERSPDSSLLWFNEHTGNKISSFDPEKLVLTEYWVPSQNRNWALCPESTEACGLANALQFASASNGQIWFTEWTENKIGVVDGAKPIPVSVSVEQEELTVARGDSVEIRVILEAASQFDGTTMAASTLTPNGRLGNSTGLFSEDSVSILGGGTKQVSYTFTPAEELQPGRQTIMVGAGNAEITVLKAVTVNIV